MEEVVVVIPIYKSVPNELERLSFEQCIKVLPYPITIVAPASLDVFFYSEKSERIVVERFDDDFFTSISGYNRLLLSRAFYKRFNRYVYMLIHQLDAYVFRDELKVWCEKGYDFIGAPVHNVQVDKFSEKKENMTLNGGLSLRKVASALKVLNSFAMVYNWKQIKESNLSDTKTNKVQGLSKSLYYYLLKNNTFNWLNGYDRNEDIFWAHIVKSIHNWYRVAPVEEALKFSFDNAPKLFLKMANGQLPFGCHSFDKNQLFWSNYIPINHVK